MAITLPSICARMPRDVGAGVDTETGLVRVTLHPIEGFEGQYGEKLETLLTGDAAEVLGEQLLAAARGADAYSPPAVRIDIDRRMLDAMVRDIIREKLDLKGSTS
jgi:hypothetical protein